MVRMGLSIVNGLKMLLSSYLQLPIKIVEKVDNPLASANLRFTLDEVAHLSLQHAAKFSLVVNRFRQDERASVAGRPADPHEVVGDRHCVTRMPNRHPTRNTDGLQMRLECIANLSELLVRSTSERDKDRIVARLH